jgi:hypothetical protein
VVKAQAKDNHGATSSWSNGFTVIVLHNTAPDTPSTPSGPSILKVGHSGTYSTSATDLNGDQVQYRFDWDASGSHDYSAWTTLGASGHTDSLSHSWSSTGTYYVKAQARDEHAVESSWSASLTVTITRDPSNRPPSTPSIPDGPVTGYVGSSYTYSTNATDPDGDQVQYMFDWDANGSHDYSSWTTLGASGHIDSLTHSWSSAGTYVVKAKARDDNSAESGWSEPFNVTISEENHPPETPSIDGLTSGRAGAEYRYEAMSTDPDDDEVFYLFDWGDGMDSSWLGPYDSGDTVTANHIWTEKDDYQIKVKAKDEHGAESSWATLEISMPKNRAINPFLLFLERLMDRFPMLERILSLPIFKLMVY